MPGAPDPLFSVAGRTALVTGASSGIGRMIARGLLERGAHTFAVGRSAAKLDALVKELAPLGELRAIAADISTGDGRAELVRAFMAQESLLHILVNNAGALNITPFDEVTEDSWNAEYDTNIKGLFFLTQALIGPIRAAGTPTLPATIINIGSIGGERIRPVETYAYQSSKAAVHHLTRGLARHLGPQNITVNAIAPGTFPTAMMPLRPGGGAQYDAFVKTVPRGRLGEPEDAMGAVVFLASRAGAYVNGAVIPLDGGLGI